MSELTDSVVATMREFEKLPGIGKKSAERIVYHLLHVSKDRLRLRGMILYCLCTEKSEL